MYSVVFVCGGKEALLVGKGGRGECFREGVERGWFKGVLI